LPRIRATRAWLGEFGPRASLKLLIEGASPSLEEFAAAD
jgi:hypothetical protein